MNRDIIVIGASVGGVEALLDMAKSLPADLPASLFVALHTAPGWESTLPELLTGRGALPARHPMHNEKILRGHIYVAPADNHLMVREGFMEVVRGPKENGHRPAADTLFRSAAASYGARVVGVVLSGYQDCGTSGLMSIKARGGVCIVQSPESAQVGEMPRNALKRVKPDYVVTPGELANLFFQLSNTPAGPSQQPDFAIDQIEGRLPGRHAELVCPICTGVLTEAETASFQHFRCHVGHTFTLQALVREQTEEMERALWSAVRVLEESAALSRRLSATEKGEIGRRFTEKAQTHFQQAELIRQILLHGTSLTTDDAEQL